MPMSCPANCSAVASATAPAGCLGHGRQQGSASARQSADQPAAGRSDEQRITQPSAASTSARPTEARRRRNGSSSSRRALPDRRPARQRQEQDAGPSAPLGDADGEGIHAQHDRGQHENSTIWMPAARTSCPVDEIDGESRESRVTGVLASVEDQLYVVRVSAACSSNSQRRSQLFSPPSGDRAMTERKPMTTFNRATLAKVLEILDSNHAGEHWRRPSSPRPWCARRASLGRLLAANIVPPARPRRPVSRDGPFGYRKDRELSPHEQFFMVLLSPRTRPRSRSACAARGTRPRWRNTPQESLDSIDVSELRRLRLRDRSWSSGPAHPAAHDSERAG